MAVQFQTTRNMRRGFGLVLLCLMGFAVAYSWNSWRVVKSEQLNQLSLLAELESKFLDSYFSHLESSLRLLTEDLHANRYPIEGEHTHLLLKRIKQANPDLANINIVSLDGQLLASALNVPGSRLPSIAQESSFVMGREVLRNGADFNIGRPFVGKLVNEWIIPLRYAIRDADGRLRYIVQSTLPLARQQSFWQSLYLPHDAQLGLIRDDGYLLSQYPSPLASDMDAVYGRPQAGALMALLKEERFPQMGVVGGRENFGSHSVMAFYRLSWNPLTLSVGMPLSHIRGIWWQRNQAFYLLAGIFLLSGAGIYGWLMRRQAALEIERDAVNRKIIDANHAKDQAEKELLALELDDIKLALDQHSIVSRSDVSGNITYVNEKFCEISGYSAGELVGQNHRLLNSGLHSAEFFINMWHTISTGKVWHGQIRNRARDGAFYWVESTIVPFLDKGGLPYQYVSIRTDITPLIRARAAAEDANRAKSKFLSSMSHELRTPLNGILGFAQLLDIEIETGQQEQHEAVKHIIEAGNQLLGLINDLLDLSRIEIGKLEFNIQSASIAELISVSVAMVARGLAGSRNISIKNNVLDPELLVQGDGLRIRQVLINLLTNAVKYNRENGSVSINSEIRPNGSLRILVSDSGEGIAADKLPLLFTPFERIEQKHGTIEGAGIGLYVSKQLVEGMRGEIGVDSKKGQGSTFWFELPLAEDSVTPAPTPAKKLPQAAESAARYRILCIEDNTANAQLVKRALEKRPEYELITATTAEEGLVLAEHYVPALILMDIQLPGIDGLTAISILKGMDETRHIPVVVLSASALEEDVERARSSGSYAFLSKPLDLVRLYKVIDDALQAQRALDKAGPARA